MKMLYWFKDYWYIPLILVGFIALWIITRGQWGDGGPFKKLMKELDVIREGAKARELKHKEGADAATREVMSQYNVKKEELDEEEREKIEQLQEDPISLARYLERISR